MTLLKTILSEQVNGGAGCRGRIEVSKKLNSLLRYCPQQRRLGGGLADEVARLPSSQGRVRAAAGRRGFTLFELLVVISVLTVLIAMLAPAFRSIKEKAEDVECMNNLRQIGVTTFLYLSENNQALPPAVDYVPWRGSSFPGGVSALVEQAPHDIQAAYQDYLGYDSKVWICPFASRKFAALDVTSTHPYDLGQFGRPDSWGYRHDITYRWNTWRTRYDNFEADNGRMDNFPAKPNRLATPGKAALMWDLPDDLFWSGAGLRRYVHEKGLNCLFLDGHVESVPLDFSSMPGSSGPFQEGTLWWFAGHSPGGWDNIVP